MSFDLIDLPWLPAAPHDFRLQVRQLRSAIPNVTALVRELAGYRLNVNQLHILGKAIQACDSEKFGSGMQAVSLGVLSNGTSDILLPAFCASAMRFGVRLNTIGTAFGQVVQEALDPASPVNRAQCDFVLVAIDHRELPLTPSPGEAERARDTIEDALRHTETICRGIQGASGAVVIVQTLPQVQAMLFGSLDRRVPGTLPWLIDAYNQELRTRFTGPGYLLLDIAALAEAVGLNEWHDPVQWALGKFLLAQRCVPLYADWLGRLIGAARGKSRKCLVLDLDNTLWGGVIGDDGLAGIVLGNGSPAGEAFLDVQQAALALRTRGIVLAVSSKNDEAVARSVFKSHPEMLLREDHIAVFQANWQDKASNLKAIAQTLNIGIDALVLLDDNPAEREQVRQALPEVAVPELPEDPAFYSRALLAAGYFEAVGFTAEDRSRAEQYQANAKRAAVLGEATDLDGYLRSLEMKAVFAAFDSVGRARIAQLINKSNQFNLTTRRYTEAQIQALEESKVGLTLQVRLIDKFGDNGMISVVICVPEGPDWQIDTWLMSCRVLNRRVEQAMLNWIVESAKNSGIGAIVGHYIATERNGMVKEHYARLGFELLEEKNGDTTWRLDVASYLPRAVPINVSISS